MLLLKNIRKTYEVNKKKKLVLDNINISFDKNGLVCILGPSGVGKTTLLNVIGGLDKIDSGDIVIEGKSLNKFKEKMFDSFRNKYIGFVFQHYNLINNASVFDNVMMPINIGGIKNKIYKKNVDYLLEKLNIKEEKNKRPNELSGGQMQRVSIARALINNPNIILCDEPTGALDDKTSHEIMKLLKEISKEKLVIMVTHNYLLAQKYADRIVKMNDGKIVYDSKPYLYVLDNISKLKLKTNKMKLKTILKLSINNLLTKKVRTILTSFGCSIGLIGLLILISISSSFKKDIETFKKETISSFPISITTDIVKEKDIIKKDNKLYTYEDNYHQNKITKEYFNYIKNKKELTSYISYYRNISFNLLYKSSKGTKRANIDNYYLFNLPSNSYLKENYKLLKGKLPVNSNELVLIVNSTNKIDKWVLELFDIDKNTVSYEEIIGKEFKLVDHNNYYKLYENKFYYNEDLEYIYKLNTNKILKIVGILQSNESNDSENTFIGYKENLINEIININSDSIILRKQLQSDSSVLFMYPGISKEESLIMLGYEDIPKSIYIYSNSFENKKKMINYLDDYNKSKIIYTDYSNDFFESLNMIINGITIVLTLFSSISLIVSSVMISVMTYISVIERKKEIGILKSLGASKNDITKMFICESCLVGVISCIISILISNFILKIINFIINNLIDTNFMAKMNLNSILIIIVINMIIFVISSFIPAYKAGKKEVINVLKGE